MNIPEHSQLGKASAYVDQYDASLLFPIPRADKRLEIGVSGNQPWMGLHSAEETNGGGQVQRDAAEHVSLQNTTRGSYIANGAVLPAG